MRKTRIYLILLGIALFLLIFLNMDKIKKIAIPLIIGIIAFFAGWFLKPKKACTKLSQKTEIVYKDTCLDNKLLCTLTSKDSLSIYRIIREGFKSKSEKVFPKVESSKPVPVEDVPEVLQEIQYTKYMNNGNTEVWDTLLIIGRLKDWHRATKLNEIVEVQEKHTETTAVIEKGSDDSFTKKTEYIPFETNPTRLKAVGGIGYNEGIYYPVGLGIQWKGLELDITKNIKQPGGNATLTILIVKIKE